MTINYLNPAYLFYLVLQRLDLSIDIIGPDQALDSYAIVMVAIMLIVPAALDALLTAYNDIVVVKPHTGSKTSRFATVAGLRQRVTLVKTPPSTADSGVAHGGANYSIDGRKEGGRVRAREPVKRRGCHVHVAAPADTYYMYSKPSSADCLVAYLGDVAAGLGLRTLAGLAVGEDLGSALPLLRRGNLLFAFNYGTSTMVIIIDSNVLVN